MFGGSLNKNERNIIWRKLNRNDLEMLQCAYNTHRDYPSHSSFVLYACTYGYLDLLQKIPWYQIQMSYNCTEMATMYGHLHILQWVVENNLLQSGNWRMLGECAAKHGQNHIVEWLFNCLGSSQELCRGICIGAIKGGHIPILELVKKYGYRIPLHDIIHGNVKVIEWSGLSFEDGADYVPYLCGNGGKVDTILWLIKKGYSTDIQEYRRIATNNYREDILKCLEGL